MTLGQISLTFLPNSWSKVQVIMTDSTSYDISYKMLTLLLFFFLSTASAIFFFYYTVNIDCNVLQITTPVSHGIQQTTTLSCHLLNKK